MDIRITNTLNEISKKHNVSISDLKGDSKSREINLARIECFIIFRDKYGFTYIKIARFFNRDTSTIWRLYHKYTKKKIVINFKLGKNTSTQNLLIKLLLLEKIRLTKKLKALQDLINIQ